MGSEINPRSVIAFSLLLSCILIDQTHGKKQGEAFGYLYNAISKASSGTDTSLFRVSDGEDQRSKIHSDHYQDDGMKEKDKIESFPGQPHVDFAQYGGYVTVDKTAGRAFYYYFVEAQHSKESLPFLLWLNGGPGCSSLGYGAMAELGPFRVYSDGKTLYNNRFSWNYAANVLFLESPAGVGFSYSNKTSDYVENGDKKTAEDNIVFLRKWLERFPEYKDRDFYIAGESYAGHYVPQLAYSILYHNKKANETIVNLKGILIGNAVIDDETDTLGMYDYFGSHALISEGAAYTIRKYCNRSANTIDQPSECNAALDEADRDVNSIDIYNIYAPICFRKGITAKPKKASLFDFDPCYDQYVHAYLNRPDVQEAMHANVTKITHDWQPCSDIIDHWNDSPSTIIPLLEEFMANGLRVWIFSGDTDGRVPVTSTQYSISKMKLAVKTPWYPWFIKGEVGGYTQVYKGDITFATVRGAGHQVPSYQPLRALALIMHFLSGTPLLDSTRNES